MSETHSEARLDKISSYQYPLSKKTIFRIKKKIHELLYCNISFENERP